MKKIIIVSAAFLLSINILPQNIPLYNIFLGDTLQASGYYFLHAFKLSGPQPSGFHTMILDKYGRLVYYEKFNSTASDFKMLADGRMSYNFTPIGNPDNGKYYIMDSTFNIVDSLQCAAGVTTDGHDLQLMPNGHYLIMGYEFRIMDLSSYHWFNGNGSPGSTTASVKCGIIQELDENKNLLFTWKAADHYKFGDVQEKWLFSPTNVDWTHFNSIAMDNDGNLLVSLRHFSEITKINRQTGDIIWRMGGKQNQFTFTGDPFNGFDGQHDARRLTNGNLTVYDDGENTNPFHPARGVEYIINEQTHIASLTWSRNYSNNSFASFLGDVQRLAGGNTVIGWGGLRNANVTFSCVKPDGSLILEMNFPDTLFTYRAFNYPSLPWALNRPLISCSSLNGNFFLSAPEGYASYKWSTGDTTRTIQITAPDTFYVFVPYGSGGYISSEPVIIRTLVNVCWQLTGISNTENTIPEKFELFQNYPNPFNPATTVKFAIPPSAQREGMGVRVVIYDALGREVITLVNKELSPGIYNIKWNASGQASGIYYYELSAGNYKNTKKMVILK